MSTKRSRWTDSDPDPIVIVPHDIDIFTVFARYRYLRVDFAHTLIGGHLASLRRRLSKLARAGYLSRPSQQHHQVNANYRYQIYELTQKGIDELHARTGLSADFRHGDGRNFAHAVMINDALANLEAGSRGHSRFITYQEIAEHPNFKGRGLSVDISYTFPTKTEHATCDYYGDAIGGFERNGQYVFFQIEVENTNRVTCNNLKQTSFLKKFLSIQQVIATQLYKSAWGFPNLLTLVVSPNQAHIDSMKQLILDETNGKGVSYIMFRPITSLDDLEAAKPCDFYTGAWQRAGHPDYSFKDRR